MGSSGYERLEETDGKEESHRSPQGSEEAFLEKLRTAKLLSIKAIHSQSRERYWVTLEGGLCGIFYPLTEQDLHTPFLKITAYRLACFLGLLETNPTVTRSLNFLDQYNLEDACCITGSLEYIGRKQQSPWTHFKQNLFFQKNHFNPIMLVEFIVGLRSEESLAPMSAPGCCPDARLEALKKLDLKSLKSHIFQKDSLCPFGTEQKEAFLKNLLKRRDAVLRHFGLQVDSFF